MARVFITGSADGLGRLSAEALLAAGHRVVVHARSPARAAVLRPLVDRGADVVTGDLADLEETLALADQVNALGAMDAVIHNAGVYSHPAVMAVNVVAPYVLTARIRRPKRLVYLSSGLHAGGRPSLDGIDWTGRRRGGSYSDSKLFITAFALAIARRWSPVLSNAVNPGWVPTKMGGPGAPDDLRLGHVTQDWLATSEDAAATTTGGYWFHQRRKEPHRSAGDTAFQDRLVEALEAATGVALG